MSGGLRLVNRVRHRPREAGVGELAEQIAGLQLIDLRGSGRAVVQHRRPGQLDPDIAASPRAARPSAPRA